MNVCFVFGTRPESVKLFPVALELIKRGHAVSVIDTMQQSGAVASFFLKYVEGVNYFQLPDPKINKYLSSQFQAQITSLEEYIGENCFDLCLVHGDTNSTLLGALAGFYAKIPVIHVEAGLRSQNIYSPFPEEMNRLLVSKLATYHAAPTDLCRDALMAEGVSGVNIVVTGNTVIDAVSYIKTADLTDSELDQSMTHILVMCHRRENRDRALRILCEEIANAGDPNTIFHVMMHPNPIVSNIFSKELSNKASVNFIEPLDYDEFILLVDQVDGVITDSGGVQEEVTYLSKPTVIFRHETERPEVLDLKYIALCEQFPDGAIEQVKCLIKQNSELLNTNDRPFGDGLASCAIVDYIEKALC